MIKDVMRGQVAEGYGVAERPTPGTFRAHVIRQVEVGSRAARSKDPNGAIMEKIGSHAGVGLAGRRLLLT